MIAFANARTIFHTTQNKLDIEHRRAAAAGVPHIAYNTLNFLTRNILEPHTDC